MNRCRFSDCGRRPGPFPTRRVDPITTSHDSRDHESVATIARNHPFEKHAILPEDCRNLKLGLSIEDLYDIAMRISDNEAAERMQSTRALHRLPATNLRRISKLERHKAIGILKNAWQNF
jgi:hypothetical protein